MGELPAPQRRRLRLALAGFLGACLLFFAAGTTHWRLVNDPAQIDYFCFLMDHGRAPYRDLLEMNMPGIYLTNWTVMHTLGTGDGAWRGFDLGLMAAMAGAMIWIALPYDWLGGFFGAALFILFHGRDGPAQQGQRDLIIAVLLVAACAFLFHALRKNRVWPWFFFGLCASAAMTIKPIPLPFVLWLLVAGGLRLKRLGRSVWRPLLAALAGMALPLTAVAAFLIHERAVRAFAWVVLDVLPFYAQLGRLHPGVVLHRLASPTLWLLFVLAVALAVMRRGTQAGSKAESETGQKNGQEIWENRILLTGIAFGFFSFFVQAGGFPYQRYPMLGFLFLWMGMETMQALRAGRNVRRVGLAVVLVVVVLAPMYAARAARRHWDEAFNTALASDLQTLGGAELSGHVQCLYVPADCDTVLFRMRLVQATGLGYDFLIFGPPESPVVERTRRIFLKQLGQNTADVIVAGRGLYGTGKEDYSKLTEWPAFARLLADDYVLYDERTFAPGEAGPRGYRIYVRKGYRGLAVQAGALRALPMSEGTWGS